MDKVSGFGPRDPEDDEIGRLIESAGPRPDLPDEDLDSIKAAARDVWHDRVSSHRATRARLLALVAAVLVAIVGGLLWMTQSRVEGAAVARCEAASGEVVVINPDDEDAVLKEGGTVHEGDRVRVTIGSAALMIGESVSLRLAGNTDVRVLTDSSVELTAGAVYVDTGTAGGSLEISTPFGSARDVGTQFEVSIDEGRETMSVSVREGEVVVTRDREEHSLERGTRLTLFPDGTVERRNVTPWGDEWAWVIAAAAPFEIEGRTLEEYLAWVSRETGLAVRYEEPSLAELAAETTLHGSTGDLPPGEAVRLVLPGAGLEGEIDQGVLTIRRIE